MAQQPVLSAEEWLRQLSELSAQREDTQLMAVKAMAAVISKEPDHKLIQRALGRFELELSLTRQFDNISNDSHHAAVHYILTGLPFILKELAGERNRMKGTGEMSTQTEQVHGTEEISTQTDELSLSGRTLSSEGHDDVNGGYGDLFPFLALPDEVIGHTFSFLSIKDRMRSRVSKRLDMIELTYKYKVDKLIITDIPEKVGYNILQDRSDSVCPSCDNCQKIIFLEGVSYSSDSIRRLTHNVSIGSLKIILKGNTDFHREVFNLMKDFDIGKLVVHTGYDDDWEEEMLVDSFLLDLPKACKELEMHNLIDNITPQAFHQVYKMMMERSTTLRKICTFNPADEQMIPFLNLIGITCRDGRFFSERKIEAIQNVVHPSPDHSKSSTRLFDGSIEISFCLYKWTNRDGSIGYEFEDDFSIELHESEESLGKAKNKDGYTKVNIVPE